MSSTEPESTEPTTPVPLVPVSDPEAGPVTAGDTQPMPDAPDLADNSDAVKPQDNGPFYKKVALVGFVAILLVGAISADQYVRYKSRALTDPDPNKVHLLEGKPETQLSPREEYEMRLAAEEAKGDDDEDGQYIGDVLPPTASSPTTTTMVDEDHFGPGKVVTKLKEKMKPVFSFLGSEDGTFSRVILRRLKDLANLVMVVGFTAVIYCVVMNPSSADGLRPTVAAPLTGLTHLEKVVFVSLSGLAVVQCLSQLYSPSWLIIVPTFVRQAFGHVRHAVLSIWHSISLFFENLFSDYTHTSARFNNPILALPVSIAHAWKQSIIKRAFRSIVPEGTLRGAVKVFRRQYGHVIYAPLWMGLLLGFHLLYVHDPNALSSMVKSAIPWVVPESLAKGATVWASQHVAAIATSQPIYATIGTWLFISFGIGGLVRPWSYKKADGSAVSKYDYYKANKRARLLHIIAAAICVGLLVLCYLPYAHTLVQAITGLPLQESLKAAWTVSRSAMWVGLQTAVRMCRVVVEAMMALQWPATRGILPFIFTMAWNGITIFAFYAIPKIFKKFCDHHELWRMVPDADDTRKKKAFQKGLNIALAFYVVAVALVSLPMIVNILLQFLSVFNYTPPTLFLTMSMYQSVYVLGPILLLPPYFILMAFQYNWIVPKDDFESKKKKDPFGFYLKRWFPGPALKLLLMIFLSVLFYTFIHFVFNFDAINGFFATLDQLAGLSIKFIMWTVSSLTQNMSWVAPYTLTFATAALFSILLVVMPTFLDSRIGGLLYLPALHFIGQMLFMWMSMGSDFNVPTALLIGGLGTFHLLTAVAILIRNWGWTDKRGAVKWLVPWYDEFRGLVDDH